jgi:hypothetical protein
MLMPEPAVSAGADAAASTAANSGPVFHGLFRSAGSAEPVAPVVSALWSNPAPNPAAASPVNPVSANPASAKPQPLPENGPEPPTRTPAAAGGPLDLFQEQLPDARALFRGRV